MTDCAVDFAQRFGGEPLLTAERHLARSF